MFDVSFIELMIIGIVGLLVLGPEKLPVAARTVGGFVRRARASWNSVRGEFEREIAADELRRTMRETAREFDLREDIREAERSFRETIEPPNVDLGGDIRETGRSIRETAPPPGDLDPPPHGESSAGRAEPESHAEPANRDEPR